MEERYLGRIHPDMEVCDVNGDKVGTVSRVYRHEAAGGGTAGTPGAPPREEIVEVKTGLLGLGTHYYVPLSAVQDATEACLFLSRPKDDFKDLGWHERPSYLGEVE